MGFNLKNKILPEGINKRNTTIALLTVGAISAGIVGYIAFNDNLSTTANTEEKQHLDINDDVNPSTITNIVGSSQTKPAPAANESSVSNNNESGNTPIIIKAKGSDAQPSASDQELQRLKDEARKKELQASYAAYSAKANSGTGSTTNGGKGGSSQPIASSASQSIESQSSQSNSDSPYLGSELIKPESPYLLQATAIIPAVMISGLNSDISGQVSAQVRENVYDSVSGKYLLIPQGSRLVGQFSNQVAYGQDRLAVAWQRVIYPNGYSINLKGIIGSDVAGFNGFYDQVDNHYWRIFGSSFVMGVITAGMQYSQNNTNSNVQAGGIGFTNPNPSVGQTVAGSLGQQMGQTGMMMTQKNLNIAPTIIVRQGYKFTIMLTADVILKPYQQGQHSTNPTKTDNQQ